MTAPALVYAGSLTDLHGLPVINRGRCPCTVCPADPFTCPTCGPPVEYIWAGCPHDPPPRRLQVTLRRIDGTLAHLVHVRAASLTANPHQSVSCSP